MNKYKEALNTLVKYAHESPNVSWALIHEENIIQELIDKETPMKPIGDKCPKCNCIVRYWASGGKKRIHRNRCGATHCGQRIDWSD